MSMVFGTAKSIAKLVKMLKDRKAEKDKEIEIAVAKETKKSFKCLLGKMVLVMFAIVGVAAVVSAISFGVYKFISARKLKALEEEFDEIEFDEEFDEE